MRNLKQVKVLMRGNPNLRNFLSDFKKGKNVTKKSKLVKESVVKSEPNTECRKVSFLVTSEIIKNKKMIIKKCDKKVKKV